MGFGKDDDGFEIDDVEAVRATDDALLCKSETLRELEGEDEVWIPRSQIHDDSEVYEADHVGKLIVSSWLARQRNWS